MKRIVPDKLGKGDEIRVIAPVRSLAIISEETRKIADSRLKDLGFKVSFGKHVEEKDDFLSTSIEARVEDLHEAFSDKSVKGILTVIGGFNSNQLLRYIDWDLIKNNPKVFCGYSDVTILNNSFYAKTGLVSYSGPHYSSFGQKMHFEYTLDYFKKCVIQNEPITIEVSKYWSDDQWYIDQDDRELIDNKGWQVIKDGAGEGVLLGGNLGTLNLLFGTEYMPDLKDAVLFIEDDSDAQPHDFDRELQSLILQTGFSGIKGLVIGRFQRESNMTEELLQKIISSKSELEGLPVIANVDFGHTDPKVTFPIGGKVKIESDRDSSFIEIISH